MSKRKEGRERLPICEATGSDCALADGNYCKQLTFWKKHQLGSKNTGDYEYSIKRFPHGECSWIIRRRKKEQ